MVSHKTVRVFHVNLPLALACRWINISMNVVSLGNGLVPFERIHDKNSEEKSGGLEGMSPRPGQGAH
jgi:hypothetical protein